MSKEYFFAYGTLQPGSNLKYFEENNLSDYMRPIGRGSVYGELVHLRNVKLNIEYPGMIISDTTNTVKGTLFEVNKPDEAFAIMDRHELYTSEPGTKELTRIDLYERKTVDVVQDGQYIKSFAYVFNPDSEFFNSGAMQNLSTIESGDWLSYIKKMPSA